MEINQPSPALPFPLEGKGTIIVNRKAVEQFGIRIAPARTSNESYIGYVAVQICDQYVAFWGQAPFQSAIMLSIERGNVGYESTRKIAYWFSFDRDNRVLKYGKGYIMEDTTLMKFSFPKPEKIEDEWGFLFDPQVSKIIEIVENFRPVTKGKEIVKAPIITAEKEVNFYPYPLILDWPYVVKDSNNVTMFDISSDAYILSASLPAPCQELYNNVASRNVDLDWPHTGNVNLSKAIGYSIATEGKILYNKIKEKVEKGEFKYIRVTLGYDRGSSPGIPYVLEIWPPESESAIHNHGNSYAVIKVLHGKIRIHIYNKTWPDDEHDPQLIKSFTASKGDVTWLSPNWYQTHRLENDSRDVYCATIQCYKFGDEDHLKWPYFDYLDGKNVENFKPDTDFEFRDLRMRLLEEYKESHSQM